MVTCTIKGCGSRTGRDKNVRFFCIPSIITRECDKTFLYSRSRRSVWLDRINHSRRIFNLSELEELNIRPHIKVCSKHFSSGQPSKLLDAKSVDWAPSCNLGYEVEDPVEEHELKIGELSGRFKVEKRRTSCDVDTFHQLKRSNAATEVDWAAWQGHLQPEPQVKLEIFDEDFVELGEASHSSYVETKVDTVCVEVQTELTSLSVGVQTELSGEDIVKKTEFDSVSRDNVALRAELQNLKQFVMTEKQLAENNSLVKFYTGLPSFTMLKNVFDMISAKIEHSHRNALSQFQEFLLIMMRLRLNLLEQDLAFRFGVSQSTISKICDKWLQRMSISLTELIPWPRRDAQQNPEVFRAAFGNKIAVIITCFEVVCDKYKQHKTVRFLIGINPVGKICFISSGWIGPGGNDKALIESSGILNKLQPGDVLLADRGFNITGCKEMCQSNSKLPIFTKGKTNLPGEDVLAKTTVNNRTYAERVNSVVRQKFRILQNSISPDLLTTKPGEEEATIDYIVRICCALTDLCPTIGDE